MPEYRRIYGPPGTGKTTELLNILDGLLESGIEPRRIAFVSFTRKAAGEARERAVERFGLEKSDLLFFRTLHSLAYSLTGIDSNNVMHRKHYKEVCTAIGADFSGRVDVEEEGFTAGDRDGDKYLFLNQLARNKMVSFRNIWQDSENIDWSMFELFNVAVSQYKEARGLSDFTDMLEKGCHEHPVDIEVAIIDEAQDMTPLQWEFARNVFSNAREVIIAGDDDQSIYKWSGADADLLNSVEGEATVLGTSYRLPEAIYSVANKIINQVGKRKEKEWNPHKPGGRVEYIHDIETFKIEKGSWLMLARNKYMLKSVETVVRASGHIYRTKRGNSIKPILIDGILAWEALRRGREVQVERFENVLTLMHRMGSVVLPSNKEVLINMEELRSLGFTRKENWYKELAAISDADREYISAVLQNGYQLTDEPTIVIDTIHGVKGGEADNVLLVTDMSYRTWEGFEADPDSEHRVFYVGATRAKESLYILMPQTDRHYPVDILF